MDCVGRYLEEAARTMLNQNTAVYNVVDKGIWIMMRVYCNFAIDAIATIVACRFRWFQPGSDLSYAVCGLPAPGFFLSQ
jgi:hypothetical protein